MLMDDHNEVAMFYHQQTEQFQQTSKQTKVIQEEVPTEVFKLKIALMNKKKRG